LVPELRRDGRRARHRPGRDPGVLDPGRLPHRTHRGVGRAAVHRRGPPPGAGRRDGDAESPRRARTGLMSERPPGVEADEPDPSEVPDAPPVPLLELREGLPPVVADDASLTVAADRIAGGHGPIAVDAERASGYRYSARAYLVQLRREGAGSVLVDPVGIDDFSPLAGVLAEEEWILHAATQDLPCLTELGLRPPALFDTELAGRLLGYPRVGLATLVETILGFGMRKEHSAVDWSTRPLPEPWLEYAALDVEVLPELRDALEQELERAGKDEWARQ